MPHGEVVEPGLTDELRSRILSQTKVIQTLKEHLSTFKKIETENLVLRQEKRSLEELNQDLRRKLEFVRGLVKPVSCWNGNKTNEKSNAIFSSPSSI